MSVAFRRESDEEHLEPKFEIPLPPGPNRVTARGKRLIDEKIASLESALAGADGEDAIATIQRDLRYWRTRQITAELAPVPSGATVEFGTVVTIRMNGKTRMLTIVGTDEADPAAGLIAFSAPLSQALMSAEPGETIAFGGREDAIELLSARPIADDPV